MRKYLWFILMALTLLSCKSTRIVEEKTDNLEVTCYRVMNELDSNTPQPFDRESYSDLVRNTLSEKGILMTNVLNLNEVMEKWLIQPSSEKKELEHFIHYQEIVNKIALAELEISSLKAAIHCEEDKVEQLAWFLERQESSVSNRRTIAGILTDASANLVSAGIVLWVANGNTFRQLLGIGASLAQITLNLLNKKEEFVIHLDHDTNIIRDVFSEKKEGKSNIIPASIWFYLHEENIHTSDGTLQENLLQSIEGYDHVDGMQLSISSGGKYNVDQLRLRGAMLDLLSSYVDLMKQDLLTFHREVIEIRRQFS